MSRIVDQVDGHAVPEHSTPDQDTLARRLRTSPEAVAAVAIAVVASALCIVGAALSARLYGLDPAAAIGLNVLHAGAIGVAAVKPRLAVTLGTASAFALMVFGSPEAGPWPWAITWLLTQLVVLGVVGARAPWRVGGVGWIVSVAGSAAIAVIVSGTEQTTSTASNVLLFASLSAAALTAGAVAGQLIQTQARLRREREVSRSEYAQRSLVQQKARIARDLHDVIAHSMSLVSIQASSAQARLGPLDEQVVSEFDQIAASARQALQEMRQVLTVLRSEDETADVRPLPSVGDVPTLVEQAQQAGQRVESDWPAVETSDIIGLAAYRIVQEALSNALRHAPDSAVTVSGEVEGDDLRITVVNTRPPRGPATHDPRGLGTLGMRERARAAGGDLDAGPTPEGGYAVTARLRIRTRQDSA